MSDPIEAGVQWLEKLLSLQGMDARVTSEERSGELGDDSYWLTIETDALSDEQAEALVGDRGQVLDSMQYLANATLNMGREEGEQHSYTLEINGYRAQRQSELQTMADEAVERVKSTGEEYGMKGLSSAERRHVHGLLGEHKELETFSRGREPDRHLVVKLAAAEDAEAESAEDGDE